MSADLPAVAARALRKSFGAQRVLDGLDWQVARGEVVGLVGKNGSGKSTLLRMLVGHEPADRGEALLLGEPSSALGEETLARLAYVPQFDLAFGEMSAKQMLRFVASFHRQFAVADAEKRLRTWGVPLGRQLSALSPGERQKVSIARALASAPELLILDEPAATLDPLARRELLEEIMQLTAANGTTVVLATHLLPDIERIADRVAFLHGGRIDHHVSLAEIGSHWQLRRGHAADAAAWRKRDGVIGSRVRSDGVLELIVDARTFVARDGWRDTEPAAAPTLDDVFVVLTAP